jgi:hypothetical protein
MLPKIEICQNTPFPLDILNGGKFIRLVLPPQKSPKSEIGVGTSFPVELLNGGKIPPNSLSHPLMEPMK